MGMGLGGIGRLGRLGRPAPSKGVGVVNLASNSRFDDATGMTLGAGWSVAGGKLVGTAVAAFGPSAGQLFAGGQSLVSGGTYRVTFTLSSVSGGSTRVQLSGATTVNGSNRNANGTYTQDLVATSAHSTLLFIAASIFTGAIDDVSVVRIA